MEQKEIKDINSCLPVNFQKSYNLLERHVKEKHFTAWSLANNEHLISSFWADEAAPFDFDRCQQNHSFYGFHPHFDLASLTKPLFLNALLRSSKGKEYHSYITQSFKTFTWHQTPWNKYLIEFVTDNSNLCLNTFLSHMSSFKAWIWIKEFLSIDKSRYLKEDLINTLLKYYNVTEQPVYSDLNYMFLILLLESLNPQINWAQELQSLNQALGTQFFHASIDPQKSKNAIPCYPYILNPISKKQNNNLTFGPVHDTNANILAELPEKEKIISSHAGLYGNIVDVLLGVQFLSKTQPNQDISSAQNKYLFGLQNKDGRLGHLGYTGTSFGFTPSNKSLENNKTTILLTNRTAQRTVEKSLDTPRIYIITNLQTKKTNYFIETKKYFIQKPYKEMLDTIHHAVSNTQKIWNNKQIIEYYDLGNVRKNIEAEIW